MTMKMSQRIAVGQTVWIVQEMGGALLTERTVVKASKESFETKCDDHDKVILGKVRRFRHDDACVITDRAAAYARAIEIELRHQIESKERLAQFRREANQPNGA
jgi:hypothetical protein